MKYVILMFIALLFYVGCDNSTNNNNSPEDLPTTIDTSADNVFYITSSQNEIRNFDAADNFISWSCYSGRSENDTDFVDTIYLYKDGKFHKNLRSNCEDEAALQAEGPFISNFAQVWTSFSDSNEGIIVYFNLKTLKLDTIANVSSRFARTPLLLDSVLVWSDGNSNLSYKYEKDTVVEISVNEYFEIFSSIHICGTEGVNGSSAYLVYNDDVRFGPFHYWIDYSYNHNYQFAWTEKNEDSYMCLKYYDKGDVITLVDDNYFDQFKVKGDYICYSKKANPNNTYYDIFYYRNKEESRVTATALGKSFTCSDSLIAIKTSYNNMQVFSHFNIND